MLILVAYYEYFIKCKPCNVLQVLLQQPNIIPLLDINPVEKNAFDFVANGPVDVPDNVDILAYLFSIGMHITSIHILILFLGAIKDPNFDSTSAHIMVNCLAVSLGLPRDTNHLYPRIFTPSVLNRTKGPGSDHNRENMDCGYQMHTDQLPNNAKPEIMGNNKQYRLALNSLVWASLSWCTLVGKFFSILHSFLIWIRSCKWT